MARSMQEWWQALRAAGAVWQYPQNPKAPHVVLRGGKHSDGYIDTLQYLSKVENLSAAAVALSQQLRGLGRVDWVFGSPMAAIPLASTVAPLVGAKRIGFTEKVGERELICRFDVYPGDRVLLIEEMTTTGGTPQRGIDAIREKNPGVEIIPIVGAFLIRCSSSPVELRNATLRSIIDLPFLRVTFNEWDYFDCPLCKAGSSPINNCKRVWPDLLQTMQDPGHRLP